MNAAVFKEMVLSVSRYRYRKRGRINHCHLISRVGVLNGCAHGESAARTEMRTLASERNVFTT